MPLAANLTTTPILAGVGIFALVSLVAVWLLPRLQVRRWSAQGVVGKDLADVENDTRGTLVQLVGGVALLATFAATWMQIADARRASDRSLRVTEQGQVTDRLSRAVEELGSTTPSVHIGGIYSLGSVSEDSPRERAPIAQILFAYLHENDARLAVDPLADSVGVRARACAYVWMIPADDVQAVMRVLSEFPSSQGFGDFRRLGLAGLTLSRADFSGSQFSRSQLAGAKLQGIRFDGSIMQSVDLRAACLTGSSFVHAHLEGSDLRNADLRGVDLRDAHLESARLSGANLSTAKNLVRAQLLHATIDSCTALPWRPRSGSCLEPVPGLG